MSLIDRCRTAALLLLAPAALAACSGSTPPPSTTPPPAEVAQLGRAPFAPGAPLPVGAITAPAQPRELPAGRLAFIVDSGYSSAYEFDLSRRRFLGPAPRMQSDPMPGYPTVLGHFAPQKAVVVGRTLYVADGGGSAISAIPITPEGLGTPAKISLQPFVIQLRPSQGNKRAMSGPAFIDLVTVLPSGHLLALGEDKVNGIGLAYAIDPGNGTVTGTLEIPIEDGWAQGAASSGATTVLAVDQHRLLIMQDNPLSIASVVSLPGLPLGGALMLGGNVVVPVDSPPRLVEVDLASGTSNIIDQAKGQISGGGVATDGARLWWALRSGEVREVDLRGSGRPVVLTFSVCQEPTALAYAPGTILAVCMDQRLALVDLAKRRTWFTPAGSFPFGIALAPL